MVDVGKLKQNSIEGPYFVSRSDLCTSGHQFLFRSPASVRTPHDQGCEKDKGQWAKVTAACANYGEA